jgi:Uma2 family endonuclease
MWNGGPAGGILRPSRGHPMNPTTTGVMTFDEFDRRHGDDLGVDLVAGRVESQGMPHALHGIVCNNVGYYLTGFVKPNRLGVVCGNDTYVRIRRDPDTVRGADVFYISYARLPRGSDLTVLTANAPELVFEVRSPTNRWADVERKVEEYLSVGVVAVVILEADDRTATVFRRDELNQVFDNGDTFAVPDVLPGFAVPVRRFFEG